jgi:hypothetical protein
VTEIPAGTAGWLGLVIGVGMIGLGAGFLRYREERSANMSTMWPAWMRPPKWRYTFGPVVMILFGIVFLVGGVASFFR